MSAASILGLLLLLLPVPERAPEALDPLQPLRLLYLEAVEDPRAIDRGLALLADLRVPASVRSDPERDALLTAYRGALVTLRAKHGVWPPARLRHLGEGLRMLDQAVTARPRSVEIRYLRLMSCYFLPGVLGRGDSVREDFAALARMLPGQRSRHSPELYRAIAGFVVERSGLPQADLRLLRETLSADE